MIKQFDLIVFDWDGTLLDSAAAIVAAITAACRDFSLPEPEVERARHVIGLGLNDALRHVVPELPQQEYSRFAQRYRFHYLAAAGALQLFSGVTAMMQQLLENKRKIAIATGKSRMGLNQTLDYTGLNQCFDATRCADECFSKPHPAMLLELMDELAVAPERTLMVGDTTHDLQMAQNAGVAALAVSFGAHPRSALAEFKPLAILDDPAAYASWFQAR